MTLCSQYNTSGCFAFKAPQSEKFIISTQKSLICGYPALKIRNLLRLTCHPYSGRLPFVARQMRITRRAARTLAERLIRAGYWEKSKTWDDGWTTTTKGHRIAIANAAPQIRRSTATRLLNGLVERMKALETHEKFLYRVSEAFVFGSYVKRVERLSDLDIAYRLVGVAADKDAQFNLARRRSREVGRHRTFRNWSEGFAWPYYEVLMFLRNRSPYIELHDLDDEDSVAALPSLVRIYPR